MKLPAVIQAYHVSHTKPKVNIYYPVIIQLEDPKIQQQLNQVIFTEMNKLLVEQNYYEPSLVELVADFEIKNNQRGILSLNLIVYSFTGGAHGMTVCKSLTFDTRTGRSYSLPDLFKPGSPYVQRISEYVRRHIEKWKTPVLEPFKQIRPDQDFYIADTSLVVYFQLYEISPYVAGFPYFPIPLLDLEDLIKPGSPADRMLPFIGV
ncbi:DUF3298 and DUF4163 domain-containing protein [Mammaliicoccus sciuri]|uniref:DUF3298 domain-containing protein n=3 Tax=Sporosarcina TaxID=1569 RepID=A0A1T4XL68_9BACL|nr:MULTISPECIES: DUF3298 and DUF4163 domain-containing protein [Sporosarcina]EGQ27984.1 hypothetical protein HMPREF9372_0026 [Sporosarcina newyorkensis 2681]MBY0222619.1 DUF3298 and DUF4163 domain-containing protein [Sporosarcina aquimarina]SKA90133.1 protein of unknown function [Sporosarcina newyorkensis]